MKIIAGKESNRDVTEDFLLCNRCGSCISACPIYDVIREEWSGPRGKIELAEAFFRGEDVDEKQIRRVSDVCLHCKTCEENCPSGARADEIILAVKNETGRRGLIPVYKRILLYLLNRINNSFFNTMRFLGLTRKGPLYETRSRSPLNFLFPILGWPRKRFVPMPTKKSFIQSNADFFSAAELDVSFLDTETLARNNERDFDWEKAEELTEKVKRARNINLKSKRRACFFIGDMVNNFFREEAEDIIYLLNLLGVDVVVPQNQPCCFAPAFYSGDIDGARKGAEELIKILSSYEYDWIVTSCASGGLMLKKEYPRLLDLNDDGFFNIEWDEKREVLKRARESHGEQEGYKEARKLYSEKLEGRIRDINELVAELLFFVPEKTGYERLFVVDNNKKGDVTLGNEKMLDGSDKEDKRPIVVYHHPCHLNRGQDINSEPEYILKMLPGHRYFRMENDRVCCGGGGVFTFTESGISEKVARKKVVSIAKANAEVVSTSCPVCRIQLMDMLGRDLGVESGNKTLKLKELPVKTPVELLVEDLKVISKIHKYD
ncbi:(Fe-S)-binding protein [bacterium]|nr:(Fe-S)-binding protein [bacterium]